MFCQYTKIFRSRRVQPYLIAKLNSTPLWNLILQNVAFLKVEFNSSYFSLIILYTNMVIPPSGKETIMNKQKHLTLASRIIIEAM